MDSSKHKRIWRASLVISFSILIAACGGGGGGGGAMGSPPTHTIGGTVTGLVGTLVLQNNGGNNLTVTANGGFTFPGTVPSGSAYSISVLSQPSGPSCAITGASGTATSNIAASVVCTVDPSTFYIPLSVKPPFTMTGTTGLYGVSSKILDRAPALIMSGNTNPTGYALSFAVNLSGHVSGGQPFALAFSTVDATGGDHVYAVDLTANSTLAPRQISSLTFPPNLGVQNCGITTAYGDLTDPNSAFFIIGVPTDPTYVCGGGSQSFKHYLIHLNDSPSFPPTELPVLNGPVLTLYQPGGALAGFMMVDAGFNLNYYRDQTFTNPKVLLTNVVGFSPIQSGPVSGLMNNMSADPSFAYLSLIHLDNSQSLYRVDYTGALSADLYDSIGEMAGTFDSDNLYIVEDFGQSGSISRMPLDGSAKPTVLLQYPSSNPYAFIGIFGSQLVLEGGGAGAPTIATLSVNGAPAPTQIASFTNSIGVAIKSGDLFVEELGIVGSGLSAATSYFSESLTLDGTVLQPLTPNSSFVCCNSDNLLQVTNTAGPTGLSMGTVSSISVTQPAAPTSTPLKDASGAPFTVSSGVVYANSYDITPTIGYVRAQTDAHYLAYFYDVSKSLMVAVPVDTSDVFVLGVPN
jgi:hypothetical protein